MTFGSEVLFCLKYYNNYRNCCLESWPTAVCFGRPVCLLPSRTQCVAVSLAPCQERRANLIALLLDVKTFSSDRATEVCRKCD